MLLSPDAMTILVGLLNDMSLMQRKVAAGQGVTCRVDVDFDADGSLLISFDANVDPSVVVVAPVPSQES